MGEQMGKTLHIVDGDSTGGTLRLSGIAKPNEILRWRDALYTGPVPTGLSLHELSRLRSHFWTKGRKSGELDERDATLAQHDDFDHIALWFGPGGTLCQLSLAQILSWFHEHGVVRGRLSWVAVHGGGLLPPQTAAALAKRCPVSAAQMQLCERLWCAFRKPSPSGFVHLLNDDTKAIPGLKQVVKRLLQEYPSQRNGLSKLEDSLLRELGRQSPESAARIAGRVMIRMAGVKE